MKWKASEEFDPYQWHEWFAWYPVKIGLATVWLEVVERRFISIMVDTGELKNVEYRDRS